MATSNPLAIDRRLMLLGGLGCLAASKATGAALPLALEDAVAEAGALPRLRTLIVAQRGTILFEKAFRGPPPDRPVNIKSAAKSVISALVGIAIDRRRARGRRSADRDRPAATRCRRTPIRGCARSRSATCCSMQAGLERTSGANYGRWVSSRDWVRFALSRPFVDEPGGRMLYSTGNTHLLSAILTRASGRSTLELARDWLGQPLDITIPAWTRDPQGIYIGGNKMALSPEALLRFGELYRQGGERRRPAGDAAEWIEASWTPRHPLAVHRPQTTAMAGSSPQARGHPVYFAWGYGGQMLYVVPEPGADGGHDLRPGSPFRPRRLCPRAA